MINRGVKAPGDFKMLVGIVPYGGNPAIPGVLGTPVKKRTTVTLGPILTNAGAVGNGTMHHVHTDATGSFTVADNTFPGPVELVLGDYHIFNSFDYLVGAAAADTAANIAAAICKLPGFSATSLLAVVTVKSTAQADDIEFRAHQHSTVDAFNAFTGSGYLVKGLPVAGPPIIT